MRASILTLRHAALVAYLLPLVAGCGSDDGSPGGPAPDELSYELQPWATELAPDVLASIVDNDVAHGVVRFQGSPELVTSRKLGDVLVGGKSEATPKGLLVAVVSVTQDGGETVVETLPVPLPLAFAKLHAKLTRSGIDLANPAAAGGTLAPSAYTVEKVVGDTRTFDTEVYNLDGKPETHDDQFLVHAELAGQVGFSATVDLDWLDSSGAIDQAKECLEDAISDPTSILDDCVTLPDVRVAFDASLHGNGLLDVDGASSKNYDSLPIALNEEPWELPDLYAGPVVLTPELDFTARVQGDAVTYFHARTEFGYDVSVQAAVGTVSGVSAPDAKFEKHVTKPVVEVSSTGRSKASFGPRLSLLAYDTFGFSAELHGFGELDADQGQTPCWDYRLGIEVTPGIRLRVPWKKFGLSTLAKKLGWNWDFATGLLEPVTLYDDHPFADVPPAERACKNPPISALPLGEGPSSETYQNPTFTPWSYRFGNVAATQPFVEHPGQSHVLVDKTHASSWLVSGTRMGSVLNLADDGSVAWARAIEVGVLPDEAAIALPGEAESALALASDALNVFVASDRFTLAALDYGGVVLWARRLRLPSGLPGPELRELVPVAITRIEGGDFAVLYSRRVVDHVGAEVVLLRLSPTGALRFAKRFAFPTGETSLGSVLVPLGQELVVGGQSFEPTEEVSYLLRFDAAGGLAYAKRLNACGSSRVRIEAGTLRASGDLAFFGTYEISPERAFLATLSPEGEPHGVAAHWSGSIVEDVTAVSLAELPTSGFVTLARWTPYVGNALELSTHDSQGIRTNGKGYALQNESSSDLASLRPAGLRLTTDGGVLAVAHVTEDAALNDYGLWISKLPAKTFDAAFDGALVSSAPDTFPAEPCTLDTQPASVNVVDFALEDLDVTELVRATPITPSSVTRLQ